MTERFPILRSEQLRLDHLKVGAHYVADNATLEANQSWALDQVQLRLMSHVLSEKLAEDSYRRSVQWTTPTSWWQMFKETYADRWWLRRLVRRWPGPSRRVAAADAVAVWFWGCA